MKSQFYESSDSEITYLTGIPVINDNKIIGRKFHRKLINDQHFKTTVMHVMFNWHLGQNKLSADQYYITISWALV